MDKGNALDLLRHLRPAHLLASLVLYLLGSGLAKYLGEAVNWTVFCLGLAWLVCAQVGFYYLGDHFKTPFDAGLISRTAADPGLERPAGEPASDLTLYVSAALLAGSALLSLILAIQDKLDPPSAVIMGVFFGLFMLLVIPGISLDLSGMGEMISSVILVVLPPALAFTLQSGSLHRSLPLVIFPLFPLHLSLVLLLRLSRYREDLALNRKTLLVRIGWIQGIFFHNMMVFSGFLLFGTSLAFGMAFRIIGPVFLALPAAVFLVWYLSRLKDGAAVRWSLLKLLTLVVFFLPAYLITYSLWIR